VTNADACGRPPVEVQHDIICGTCFEYPLLESGNFTGLWATPNITGSRGGDWDLFAPCCPSEGKVVQSLKNTTIYYTHNSCGQFCLVNDTAIANAWDQCVTDRLHNFTSSYPNQTYAATYCGRCEYLNKDFLKKGLKSGAVASAKYTAILLITGLAMAGAVVL
jgi:hypothetical protein